MGRNEPRQRKRASEERKNQNNELAYALLFKSTELMKNSKMLYSDREYLRIAYWLYEDGNFDEAERFKIQIQKDFPLAFSRILRNVEVFKKILNDCKTLETDYVFCSPHGACCGECSKYQCRVYCISGDDKRFPKLPDIVKKYGGFHEGCHCSFFPHSIDIYKSIQDINSIEHDERTEQEFII